MGESAPIATLSSGQTIRIRQVRLYNEELVREIAVLRQQALKSVGGVSAGIGFWGSPEWVVGGSLALGLVESFLSGSAREKAADILRDVQKKMSVLVQSGKLVEFTSIVGLDLPDPRAWMATETIEEPVFDEPPRTMRHSSQIPRYAPEEMRQMLLKRADPKQIGTSTKTIRLVHSEDDFVAVGTDVGVMKIRWSSVVAYLPPQSYEAP